MSVRTYPLLIMMWSLWQFVQLLLSKCVCKILLVYFMQTCLLFPCNLISNLICDLSSVLWLSDMCAFDTVPRPPDPPEMLTAVTVNSTTVVLQWREPPLTTTANVTGYLVQYSHPARENSSNSSVPLPSHARTISITDLDGGQLYQFNVSAINTVGTGPPAMYILSTPIGEQLCM